MVTTSSDLPAARDNPPARAAGVDAAIGKSGAPGAAFSPLYRQIKVLLLQSLERGEWKPGELIPSEFDLAARFQVSQGTVRKAVDELAAEHVLQRRQGKGTFVSTHHEARTRYRFLRLAPDGGDENERAESRIIDCKRMRAPTEVAKGLELRAGETVVAIRRLLLLGHVPTVVDDIWLPGALFKGLSMELLAQNRNPLYALFESEFGVSMIRADEKLRATGAPQEIAEVLKITPGTPLLQADRLVYTYGDKPVEIRRGWYLTDRYHYRNSLN